MELLLLSLMSPNQDLVIVLALAKMESFFFFNGVLSWSVRNALISKSGVLCLIDPCHPLQESNFAITNQLFA